MDISALFKACVKTVKTRNKALGIGVDSEKNSPLLLSLKKSPKSEFSSKAKELVSNISKMRDFLLQHRKNYINMNYILYEASKMTDVERDEMEKDVQIFIQGCSSVIKNLKNEVNKNNLLSQELEHRDAVIEILESYLKAVCRIFTEQKAIRVKRTFEKQKLDRLETAIRGTVNLPKEEMPEKMLLNTEIKKEHSNKSNSFTNTDDVDSRNGYTDLEFSAREIELFEQENLKLYEELNSMIDEVRQIEGKVVEISRLQEVFADKVLQQEQDINKISDVTVGATENIKDGNEELREAMRKKAGFRIWIMFFLLVLSFSLLFLDWYNP